MSDSDWRKPRVRMGTVTAVQPGHLVVTDGYGDSTIFVKGSIHYPGDLPLGTKGTIEYVPSGNMALDWFTPEGAIETAGEV